MQITHVQAQTLIQLGLDGSLQSAERSTLSAHLRDCKECQVYARDIHEVESLLRPLLKRQWNVQPVPLSIAALTGDSQKSPLGTFLSMRKAAVSLVFLVLFFGAWQFASSRPFMPNVVPLIAPSIPTPSLQTAQSTSTENTLEDCELMLYTVQANDTLASIADRFLLSKEQIMELNQLQTGAVNPSMELVIPICHFTPTGTIHPATFTTTYTPVFHSKTSTPDG